MNCTDGCKDNICDKDSSSCTNGCVDGYFQETDGSCSPCILTECRPKECYGNQCTRCNDGFYLDKTSESTRDYCKTCPSTCASCDGYEDCYQCNIGHYGYRCQFNCTDGCKDNICDKDFSSCTNGCVDGYFQETDGSCSPCIVTECRPTECHGNNCTRCNDGFYLDTTLEYTRHYCKTCPSTCASCDGYEECSQCNTGHYGYRCQLNCTDGCKDNICDKDSSSCTNGCVDGYYHETDGLCSPCILTECRPTECHGRCKAGFYLDKTSDSTRHWCKPCPPTCASCDGYEDCSQCNTGHYGYRCQLNCTDGCKDNICDKDSSSCTNGCVDGYFQETDGSCSPCILTECRPKECYGNQCTRCNDGFYLDKTSESTRDYCKTCPSTCASCDGYEDCYQCNIGHYGYRCQFNCTDGCKDNICDKDFSSCTNGCVDGYFQETDGSCSPCIVTECRPTECHGNNCTRCNDGFYLDTTLEYTRHYCKTCPSTCASCDGYEECSQCNTDHYGYRCQLNCTDGCKDNICDKDSSSCTNGCVDGYYHETDGLCSPCILTECRPTECHGRCKAGFYLDKTSDSTRHWCKPCPPTCASCDGYEDCSQCNTGHYGYRCQLNCTDGCKDNICDKDSSSCTNGCVDGYFQETDGSCSPCILTECRPKECYGNQCTRCNDGFYLDKTSECTRDYCKTCPSTCASCDGHEDCYQCNIGHYGYRCQFNCTDGCKDNICDKDFSSCTNGCVDGYFQETDGSCNPCIVTECRPTECHGNNCTRCNDGFYLDTTLEYTRHYCKTCPSTCASCDGYEDCSQCNSGHYGYRCQLNCTDGCKDNICDKDSSSCTNGCVDGYYHETDGSCSPCILTECRPTECHGNNCTRCKAGFYLDKTSDSTRHWCKPCPPTCAMCDGYEDCSQCNTGHYGYRCQLNCTDGCIDNICDKDSSSCTNGCVNGYNQETDGSYSPCILTEFLPTECHGNNCTRCKAGFYLDTNPDSTRQCCKPCPSTCASCDGYEDCSQCNTGHYGYRCQLNCTEGCKDDICDKDSGSCTNGCVDGYYHVRDILRYFIHFPISGYRT